MGTCLECLSMICLSLVALVMELGERVDKLTTRNSSLKILCLPIASKEDPWASHMWNWLPILTNWFVVMVSDELYARKTGINCSEIKHVLLLRHCKSFSTSC